MDTSIIKIYVYIYRSISVYKVSFLKITKPCNLILCLYCIYHICVLYLHKLPILNKKIKNIIFLECFCLSTLIILCMLFILYMLGAYLNIVYFCIRYWSRLFVSPYLHNIQKSFSTILPHFIMYLYKLKYITENRYSSRRPLKHLSSVYHQCLYNSDIMYTCSCSCKN